MTVTTATRKRAQQPSSCPDGHLPAGHVRPLQLTKKQQIYCRRAVGVSRFVYNLCVATHKFCRTNRLKWPSGQDLNREFNAIKQEHSPFVTEVSYPVAEGAVRDFGTAVNNWFDPNHNGQRTKFHRNRLTGSGSFRAASGVRDIQYNGKRRIRLPNPGSIKLAHTLPKGIIHEAHITFQNGQRLLSVNYWKPPVEPETEQRIQNGAVDTGINPSATDSDGQTWENPKAYYKAEHKLARWQRAQAHRTRASRDGWEAQHHIDRLQRRIVGLRKNATHQMTSELVHKYQNLVIEDLNVAGMMQGSTSKAQADASMGEIKRQLTYKGQWNQCNIYLANRFYPSSKTCSNCNHVNAKLKRQPYWQCPSSGVNHERNYNAALNLHQLLTLLPSAGGTLRDGKALAPGSPGGATARLTGERQRSPREHRRL